jgi:hypothetical protein
MSASAGTRLRPLALATIKTMGTPSEYEQFIAGLARDLLAKRKITNLGYGRKNRLTGRSGVSHQLDVSFVDIELSPSALVVIECKRLAKRIVLSDLKVLRAIRTGIYSQYLVVCRSCNGSTRAVDVPLYVIGGWSFGVRGVCEL